jgi:hypothetical protein
MTEVRPQMTSRFYYDICLGLTVRVQRGLEDLLVYPNPSELRAGY